MKQQNEIVKKVLNYIEDNIEKEINVDKIARSVGYSKFYLADAGNGYTVVRYWYFPVKGIYP